MAGRSILELTTATFNEWWEDDAPRLGASLAYYAVFSVAPLLIIVVAVVGFFYRGDTVGQIESQLAMLVGREAAEPMAELIKNSTGFGEGTVATAIGLLTLFIGATGVFSELRAAMNKIWGIQPKQYIGVMDMISDRFFSFAMVLSIAFLLLVSMAASALLSATTAYFSFLIPGFDYVWHLLDIVVSLSLVILLFAMLFRYVPDKRIPWKDVWVGAAVTAVLFVIGKILIGWYLGQGSFASTFGAAGSLMVFLAWVYYTSQIVFLGAEFTQVYSRQREQKVLELRPAA